MRSFLSFILWRAILLILPLDVLVTGAAGVVGRYGIQVARDIVGPKHSGEGAKVIAQGWKGGKDEPFADLHIERTPKGGKSDEWLNQIPNNIQIDVVFDNVGGEVLEQSLKLVKEDGIVITIGTPIPDLTKMKELGVIKKGVNCHFFIVGESGDQLKEIADLIQEGKLQPEIGLVADGLTEQNVRSAWKSFDDPTRHLQGGVVVKVYEK